MCCVVAGAGLSSVYLTVVAEGVKLTVHQSVSWYLSFNTAVNTQQRQAVL